MTDRKDDGTGELDDEKLGEVTGGVAGIGSSSGTQTTSYDPNLASPGQPADASGGTEVASSPGAPEAIPPRDSASGLPTGKRTHKPFLPS